MVQVVLQLAQQRALRQKQLRARQRAHLGGVRELARGGRAHLHHLRRHEHARDTQALEFVAQRLVGPVQVQRATRGKALKINFGASIHRVVGLDIADAVFEPGTTEMRPQWRPRIDLLLTELQKAPSVLRLSYVADVEEESLVNRRLDAFKEEIMRAWEDHGCCYELVVEPEIFWRLGGPPGKSKEAGR